MKKVICSFVLVIVIIIVLTMVFFEIIKKNDKVDDYASFEHFTYNDISLHMIDHDFFHGRDKQTYAIADISDENLLSHFEVGLFYKIKNNDYILLDEFDLLSESTLNQDDIIFYQNEKGKDLLIISMNYGIISIYSLDITNTKKISLKYPPSKDYNVREILNIENDILYLRTNIHNTDEYVKLKCSLVDFKCVEYTENN